MSTVVFEPASAIAAGLCLTARIVTRHGVTERHPRRCGWCDYEVDDLRRLIEGFNEWAGFNERDGTYSQHDARAFQALPRREQVRLVEEAQSFEPEPTTEDLSWLG